MHQHLCRAALFLVVVLSCTGTAAAQSRERPHAIESGSWAVLYQVEDGLRLNLLDGMLSLKYHLTDRRAVRVGIDARANTGYDRELLDGQIGAQAQYFLYPQPEREVKFYIGAGPHIGYHINRTEQSETGTQRYERWTFGVAGALGTEWFATKHISLFAEYGKLLGMRVVERELPLPTGRSIDYFYTGFVRLGLGVYL